MSPMTSKMIYSLHHIKFARGLRELANATNHPWPFPVHAWKGPIFADLYFQEILKRPAYRPENPG